MSQKALGKHGWSVVSGLLLCTSVGVPVLAAPNSQAQVAIGSPLPHSLVGGKVTLSVAFNTGTSQIQAFTVYVDDQIQYSRSFLGMNRRGINYLDLDTTTLPDGNHTVKVVAMGVRGALAVDEVKITIKNGVMGGPDVVPPLVQFKNLMDGDEVSGEIDLDVLAEDNATNRLLVSVFVNQDVRLIRNTPPYLLHLDTAKFLDPATGRGEIKLEAWAFDDARNKGIARPITLKVVPAGIGPNQTPKKDDPTTTRVRVPEAELREPSQPVRENTGGEAIIPLGGRSGAPAGKSGTSTRAAAGGRAVIGRPAAAKPAGPRMATNTAAAIRPDFAPASAEEAAPKPSGASAAVSEPTPANSGPMRGSLAPVREADPGVPRPTAPKRAAAAPAGMQSPDLARSGDLKGAKPAPGGPRMKLPAVPAERLTGPRTATGGRAPAKPIMTAKATPAPAPNIVPEIQSCTPPADMTGAVAPTSEMPDSSTTLPMGSSYPMPSPGGQRPAALPVKAPSAPSVSREKPAKAASTGDRAASERLVVVVPKEATPNAMGRVPAQVFRVKSTMPEDRTYKMRRGDDLNVVARKFGVTPKSLMVVNSITDVKKVRAGSILKVPGAFDVVLNGEKVNFDVSPRMEEGMALAPFRQIFEHTGGVVLYQAEGHEVHATSATKEVKLKIGSKEATVNKAVVMMEREAFLDSGRTIVPMSFLEKALDLKAEYDVKTGAVILARR